MEDVQLYRFHAVQSAIDHIERHEVPAHIQHQPAPGKPRLVVNGHGRNGETSRRDADQLQKGLQAVEYAQRIGGFKVNLIRRDLQVIGLVFIHLLHRRARALGLDEERRLVEDRLAPQRDPGLPRKDIQEALFGPFQPWLLKAFEGDAKPVVDEKLACHPASLEREEASRAAEPGPGRSRRRDS